MSTTKPTSAVRQALGKLAPKLVDLTEDVLFGDVWERPQLSKRDRSLITCAALVATGKTEQMDFHFPNAVKNGVTPATFAYGGEGARLPSLKGIMAAKKKPMANAKLADYGAEPKAMIKETGVTLPAPRPPGQIVADIPTLVKKLAEEAKVL